MVTRSNASVWLIGHPEETITGCRLPCKGQVLRHFFYYHTVLKKTKSDSASAVIESVVCFWNAANVPISTVCYCKKKLVGLVEQYEKLKKSRLKDSESCRMNEDIFRGELEELFDISTRDAQKQITNEEDRAFLISQQEDRTQSTMAGLDRQHQKACEVKRKRMEAEQKRKKKSDREKEFYVQTVDSSKIGCTSASSSDSEDAIDQEFATRLKGQHNLPKRVLETTHAFLSPTVTSTLIV
jgi:hypothetical protein